MELSAAQIKNRLNGIDFKKEYSLIIRKKSSLSSVTRALVKEVCDEAMLRHGNELLSIFARLNGFKRVDNGLYKNRNKCLMGFYENGVMSACIKKNNGSILYTETIDLLS